METPKQMHARKGNMAVGGSLVIGAGALLQGFGDCAFDVAKADACVAHAASMVDKFQAVGDHLIQWGIAIFQAVF